MNASALKFDLSAHGQNCSDKRCPLPVCINWKLVSGVTLNQQAQKPKRNRLTSADCSPKSKKFQRNEIGEKLDDDEMFRRAQVLEDVLDLQKYFPADKSNFPYSFTGFIQDASQNANLLPNQPKPKEDFRPFLPDSGLSSNQLRNQQQPYIISNLPLDLLAHLTKKPAAQIFDSSELPAYEMSTVSEVLSDIESVANYIQETDSINLGLGQFVPMCPTSTENCTIAKRVCDSNASKVVSGSVAIDDSVCGPEDHKEGLHEKKNRPIEQPNKLFGVVAEILRLFELPMSKELEASYVQVLQRALAEIRRQRLRLTSRKERTETRPV